MKNAFEELVTKCLSHFQKTQTKCIWPGARRTLPHLSYLFSACTKTTLQIRNWYVDQKFRTKRFISKIEQWAAASNNIGNNNLFQISPTSFSNKWKYTSYDLTLQPHHFKGPQSFTFFVLNYLVLLTGIILLYRTT